MNVKFISVTAPAGDMTAEELIAYTARVSSPENQENKGSASKLLGYCMKHGHWSVFEMADLTVEVKTSLAIATQILRHKSMSFQMFSQRYAKSNCEFEHTEARAPHPKNRQLSEDTLTDEQKEKFGELMDQVQVVASQAYEAALELGVAKEVARFCLPQCTQTTMYMKGSVRSWLTYFMQRLHPSTQLEHRCVAQAAYAVFAEQFPACAEMLRENYPNLEYR